MKGLRKNSLYSNISNVKISYNIYPLLGLLDLESWIVKCETVICKQIILSRSIGRVSHLLKGWTLTRISFQQMCHTKSTIWHVGMFAITFKNLQIENLIDQYHGKYICSNIIENMHFINSWWLYSIYKWLNIYLHLELDILLIFNITDIIT